VFLPTSVIRAKSKRSERLSEYSEVASIDSDDNTIASEVMDFDMDGSIWVWRRLMISLFGSYAIIQCQGSGSDGRYISDAT